ncbi:MAG: DUF4421 family protein [Flavobacteriales bacterium]|nr:DUF4421 family protein [Flavobacteriales bacterium]
MAIVIQYSSCCSFASIVVLAFVTTAHGQSDRPALAAVDTSYVRDFSNRPAIRLYLSAKFNSMVVRSNEDFTDLRYRPNGNYNMGIGASYRRLTLNIGFPMPFVNNDDEAKGRTRFLDAQATLHTQRQASNLFLQVFKGYHITSHTPSRIGWDQTTSYPYRPDLIQFNIGLSSLRIVNHTRFSYRATFNQDAWQQRSQGTWLYGGYATCYVVKADSALVPARLLDEFGSTAPIAKALFVDLGPMGGYAHTFVHRTHWFLTVSGALGAGPSVQRLRLPASDGTTTRLELGPGWHAQFRAGIGYNSRYRYVGLLFNQEHIGYVLRAQNTFAWDVGNFRLMVVQRLKDRPKRLDRGLRWLKRNTALPVPGAQ